MKSQGLRQIPSSGWSRRSLPAANQRWVLLLSACILFSALIGCSRDPNVKAEKHYARAEAFLNQNNTDAAMIELRAAIQNNPKMAKARFELANLELQRGSTQIAFQEFLAAVKADPKHRQAQIMIGEMLARAGNFSDSKAQAQLILSGWPDDTIGTLLMAESEFGLGDYKQSRELVDGVLATDPNNARALSDLAYLQLQEKKTDEAEATLLRVWRLQPNMPDSAMALSSLYEKNGDLQRAENVLKEARQQNSADIAFTMLLANFYVRQQRMAEAEPLYRQIQQDGKGQSEYRDILAEFFVMNNRPQEAEAEYKRLVQADKKDWQSWRGLAAVYLGEGKYPEASDVIDRLLKNNPKEWQGLALKGKLLLGRGQPAEAITELEKSRKQNPAAAETMFDLARAYIAVGKLNEAQSALQDLIKINPNYPQGTSTLAAILISKGHLDQAIEDLKAEVASKPNAFGTRLLLAQAYIAKGDYPTAEAILSSSSAMASTPKAKGTVLQLQASIKLSQKQFAPAAKLAGEALENDPKSAVALTVLGASYIAQKQPDQGIAAIESQLNKTPDWAEGYEILGKVAQQTGRLPVATEAFNHALTINPGLSTASIGLADTYFLAQQFDLAQQQYLKAAARQDPTRSYALFRLGQIAERKGDYTGAKTSYESALDADPENVVAKNNLAWVYAEHGGNVDLALKLAEEAKEKAPNDPGIADTLGWIYVKKGSYEAAVENLKGSAAMQPNNPAYLYHLGTAYYKLGRTNDARRELEAALRIPNFGDAEDARKLLAQLPPR